MRIKCVLRYVSVYVYLSIVCKRKSSEEYVWMKAIGWRKSAHILSTIYFQSSQRVIDIETWLVQRQPKKR